MTAIRVADAPLLDLRGNPIGVLPRDRTVTPAADDGTESRGRRLFFLFVLTLLLFSFLAVLGPRNSVPSPILTIARYLLWPCSIIGVGLHVQRFGTRALLRAIAPMLPFLAIGVFAGLIGYQPVESARQITFWVFGILAAATIGAELPPILVRRYLFLFLLVCCVVSIALAVGVPAYGTVADNRAASGLSWRGVFVSKNLFGEIAAYLLILSYIVPFGRGLRAIGFVVAAACLGFADSQGAVVTAAVVMILIVGIEILRRIGLSPGVQGAILGTATIAFAVGLIFGLGPLLGALGRDPTLTGRTTIWSLYGRRALYFWLHGAGPGTFNDTSVVTADLTFALQPLGRIVQPHNMFIAVFGETGIAGALAMILPLCWFALVLPFVKPDNRNSTVVAALALAMLIGGLNETHEVFGPGFRIVFVLLAYAGLLRDDRRGGGGGTAGSPAEPIVLRPDPVAVR